MNDTYPIQNYKMKKNQIVKIFREISYLIQIAEEDPNTIYKVRAYERAADVIENLSTSIEEIYPLLLDEQY